MVSGSKTTKTKLWHFSKMAANKFCGYAKLETGGLVVGLFGIIINALHIHKYLPPILEKFNFDDFDLNSGLSVLMLIILIYFVINLITSIVLIIGTIKVTV